MSSKKKSVIENPYVLGTIWQAFDDPTKLGLITGIVYKHELQFNPDSRLYCTLESSKQSIATNYKFLREKEANWRSAKSGLCFNLHYTQQTQVAFTKWADPKALQTILAKQNLSKEVMKNQVLSVFQRFKHAEKAILSTLKPVLLREELERCRDQYARQPTKILPISANLLALLEHVFFINIQKLAKTQQQKDYLIQEALAEFLTGRRIEKQASELSASEFIESKIKFNIDLLGTWLLPHKSAWDIQNQLQRCVYNFLLDLVRREFASKRDLKYFEQKKERLEFRDLVELVNTESYQCFNDFPEAFKPCYLLITAYLEPSIQSCIHKLYMSDPPNKAIVYKAINSLFKLEISQINHDLAVLANASDELSFIAQILFDYFTSSSALNQSLIDIYRQAEHPVWSQLTYLGSTPLEELKYKILLTLLHPHFQSILGLDIQKIQGVLKLVLKSFLSIWESFLPLFEVRLCQLCSNQYSYHVTQYVLSLDPMAKSKSEDYQPGTIHIEALTESTMSVEDGLIAQIEQEKVMHLAKKVHFELCKTLNYEQKWLYDKLMFETWGNKDILVNYQYCFGRSLSDSSLSQRLKTIRSNIAHCRTRHTTTNLIQLFQREQNKHLFLDFLRELGPLD